MSRFDQAHITFDTFDGDMAGTTTIFSERMNLGSREALLTHIDPALVAKHHKERANACALAREQLNARRPGGASHNLWKSTVSWRSTGQDYTYQPTDQESQLADHIGGFGGYYLHPITEAHLKAYQVLLVNRRLSGDITGEQMEWLMADATLTRVERQVRAVEYARDRNSRAKVNLRNNPRSQGHDWADPNRNKKINRRDNRR